MGGALSRGALQTKPHTPREMYGAFLIRLHSLPRRGDYLSSVLALVFVQIDTLEACSCQRLRCGVQIALDIHLGLTYEGLV